MIRYCTSLTTSSELFLSCATSLFLFLGKTNPCAPVLREGLPQDSVGTGAARPLQAPQVPATHSDARSRHPEDAIRQPSPTGPAGVGGARSFPLLQGSAPSTAKPRSLAGTLARDYDTNNTR